MDRKTIFERSLFHWTYENETVCIVTPEGKLMLNPSVRKVWELLGAKKTLEDIYNEMIQEYGKENEKEYIISVVDDSIKMLLEYHLIEEKSDNLFEGWIQYE